jgi:FKBP-type peptidyl-prolyl cis-trans isomerase
MIQNKWFTAALMLFMAYAFLTQPNEPSKKESEKLKLLPEEIAQRTKTIETIKSYISLFTDDPKEQALNGKEQPLISSETELDKNSASTPTETKNGSQYDSFKNKLSNLVYNILHTKQGKELLEKALFNPLAEPSERQKAIEENPYNNNSKIDIVQGEGEAAECGDIVTAHYITRLVSGQEIENTHKNNKALTFQLGDRKVIKGLEYAIIGMKKGGVRR